MAGVEGKNMKSPDETRDFPNGKLDIVRFGKITIGLATFQPGWRWSESVKPIVGTDSCQQHHTGYVMSGRMKVVMDDGTEAEFGPGDAMNIEPGHDAWVVGDEPWVGLDVVGAERYAKP